MKPRIKDILLASVPVLLGGIWGFWMLGRTPLLSSGIDRALGKLQQQGIGTQVTDLEWTSFGSAHIAQIVGVIGADTLLRVNDIDLHMRPRLSLSGRDWVHAVNFGAIKVKYHGWQVTGQGRFFPSTLALQMDGEFEKWKCESGLGGHVGSQPLRTHTTPAPSCLRALVAKPQRLGSPDKISTHRQISGHFRLRFGDQSHTAGRRHFDAGVQITQLAVQHPALGDDIKMIRELDAWARIEVFANAYTLRPGSCLRIGDAVVLGSGSCDVAAHTFALRLAAPRQPAANLLTVAQAIAPIGLQDVQVSGDAQGYLRIAGDLDSLAALELDGDFSGEGITLVNGGTLRLDTLPQLAAAEALAPLATLPPYLVQAVVLSEDANFWTHHSFDKDIIRLAIAENWEAGKFVRGAGTIPMQLMRNIYLHHGKQADRKLAEITLTWIAEETQLIDKEAQLELYLNLIEWGTDVYGIHAAAQHYFHKTPDKLTVDESIFLAAIIPNPRYAAQLLEADGSLTPYAEEYYDTMRWMLYEGDFIGEEWLEADYPRFRVSV